MQIIVVVTGTVISIHALLAESDTIHLHTCQYFFISIHALLAESDVTGTVKLAAFVLFLSTLSLRRATHAEPTKQA